MNYGLVTNNLQGLHFMWLLGYYEKVYIFKLLV